MHPLGDLFLRLRRDCSLGMGVPAARPEPGNDGSEANVHTRAMQAGIGMFPADPHEPAITWRTLWQALNDGFQSNTAATGVWLLGLVK